MAKGRSGNKEQKKPKQAPAPVAPVKPADLKVMGGVAPPRKT